MDFFDVPEVDENDVELIDIHKDDGMAVTQPNIPLAPSMIAMQKPLSLDENAEAEDIAGRLNLPAAMVGTDLPRYRKMAQARDIDASTADSPVFRDWMGQDNTHLSVGMQDSQNLVDFEKVMMAGPDGLGRAAMQPKFDEKTTVTGREGLAYSKVEDIRNEPTGPSVMLDFDETTGEYREPNKWEKQVAQADKAKRLAEANTELREAREASGDWLWSDSFGARPYRRFKKGAIDLKASFWGALQGVDEAFADLTRAIPGLSEFFQMGANYAAQQFSEGKTLAESITEKDKGGTLQQVSDAVFENLPQMLVTMGFSLVGMAMGGARGVAAASPKVAAALLGRQQAAYAAKAGASSMGAMIYGETYGSAREAGSSALQANLGAVPNAIIQGALENIGLGKIFKAWNSTGAMSYIKNTLTAALTEGVTEWIQQFPDDFFHMVSLIGSREGPDGYAQGMSEFVQGLPNTIEGANMGAAVGAIYGMLFALPGLRGQARRERLMANDKLFFDALNDSAQSSALREKLPGMYQDIVSRVTENGPVQNVYVPAEDLTAAAISLDQDVYELAESIGVSRQELDHAAGLGADVEIPLALYQSKVAGTEAGLRLSGKVKTSADGMTLEEMATERQRTVASVVNALRDIQNNQQMEADLDEALADIRQGLLDAGHSESQADANLALLKARAKIAAATWSAIKGQQVTPAQWVRDYAGVSLKTEEAEGQGGMQQASPLAQLSDVPLQNAMEGDLSAPLTLNTLPEKDVEILRKAGLVKTYDSFDPETGEKTGTYEGVDKEALFQERDRRAEEENRRTRERLATQEARNERERQAILNELSEDERAEAKDLSLYRLRKYAQDKGYDVAAIQGRVQSLSDTMEQMSVEELESNLEVMDEEIDEILSRDTAGPDVEDPVSLSSKLYQVQDIPEWRELTAAWMKAHNYTQEQIDARLAAMEGQVKLQAALADKISAVMVGAGIAARKTAGGYTTSGPVRTNIDPIYRLSFDLSSQCVKRLSSARTVNRVQKELGRPLTVGEQLALIALYRYEGLLAPCLYCYVESNRRKATETVGSSREVVVNGNIPEAWSDVRKKLAAAAIKEFKEKGMTRDDIHFEYIVDEVASFTPEAEEWKRKYPKVANFLQKEADATKQNKAKPYEEYVADLLGDWVRDKDGNIKFSKSGKKSFRDNFSPEKVKELNGFAGLRFFSTSDFQIEHFVDLLQAFWDMQLLGLKSHAYTKVEEYVKIFGGSRQKINLSCFAKEDENGNIVADTDQGWDWEKAKEYRAKHPDVGIIIVTGNDKILDWAMKQDWIDYCIPFHYSGLSSDVYQSQGWQDSTSTQMEEGFDAKPVVGVPKEQANDIAERLASGEITEQEASVEYARILFENDSYGGKMEALFKPETLPENTGTAGAMRNAAKKKWLAMVESGTFDATDINPQYFTVRRKSEKAKDAAINPVEVHHVRMYEMGTQDGITDAQGVHNYLQICAKERLIPVFPNFMWRDRQIAETNEERTAMVREAKQRWKAIVEDPKYGGHWEGTEKDKTWVLSDEGWNQMWADIQDQIDPAFFKVKKDYARTDTPFEVVDPEGIDVGAAQDLLAEAFNAEGGLEQKYAENKSIGDKLMEMIAAAKRTYEEDLAKTPGKTQAQKEKILSNKIGIDALKAVRFGIDPWAEKTGNEDRQLPSKRAAQELRPYSEVKAEQQAQQRPTTLNQEGLTPEAQILLQRAFHGSPHRFTQFMLEHIGRGEGGQVHGWGLYFAQNREVSEGYREKLADDLTSFKVGHRTYQKGDPWSGGYVDQDGNKAPYPVYLALTNRIGKADKGEAVSALRERSKELATSGDERGSSLYEEAAQWLESNDVVMQKNLGQVYEVEIPENNVLLDEQAHFYDQSRRVQNAIRLVWRESGGREGDYLGMEGRDIYDGLSELLGSDEAASRALNEAGINGITYEGGQDGRCFVIFDDQAVEMIDTFYQLQQEQTRPWARGQIEFVGDNEAIITLFKGAADLSTFAHESAHLFMRDLERMAMSSNAPQEIVDDYLALKRWAAPQIEGWYNAHLKGRFGGKAYADLTAEERDAADYVAEQELLAEGFLTYLKEGKAPSQELRSVFGRFRDWLTSIYRAIMGQGFTPVNDEVRAVFDRMLASQQDVAEMEQVHAATDAERAEIDRVGADMLTENERKRLEDARRKAKARASEKTLLDRLKAYFAATGEKKKIEAQARAEVDAQPVNAAVNDALAAGGISYDSVVEQYGEETAKALAKKRPTLLRKEGGVDISQAAATQDLSPDDLVTGILNAPKKEDAVKAVTDRMLAEREEEIRQEMQEGQDLQPGEEGYYSDDQLSALLIEATALARKAGHKVRTTGNAEANRAWARGILNRMTLSEASVHRLSAAEAKQAAKAAQLLAEGKVEEAADAKRRQAILHAMVLEAVAFRKKLDGFTRKMKRWDHRKVKDQDAWAYQEQLRALAQRYRIGGRDRFAPERPQELSRLRDFLKAHDDEDSVFGEAPWSEWLLNEEVPEENGRLKLTVEQYEEIMALGQHLAEGMDPGEAKVISEGLEGTVAELVDKASTTLENSGNKFTYREEGTLARKGQDLWKSLFAGLDNAQYVLMAADGYEEIGKNNDKQGIHSYLFRLMKEAIGRYGQRYRNALPELQELAVVRENFAKRFEKTYGKRAEQINGVATPEAMREVGRPRWTAEHIWCIARNMGNEGNLKTLREGYGLTDEDLINLTSILTKEEWQAIQRECELVGASYDETDAVFRKIYGVPMPDRVQPDPITVTCADGTQLDLPGWYFPIAVDTAISPDIGDKQEISAIRDNPDFTALGPAIRRGHTHARTGTGKACALRYEVFESALWDQWRFIEMGPIVKDLDRLTRNKKWRKAFTDAFGPQYYKEIREWLKYAARPTQPKKDVIAKLESSLRAKATIFAMGFNVNTFVRQFGGYPQALPDVGFKYLLKGLSYAAMHPIAMWRQINEMSPMMADRDKNFVRELRSHIMKMQKAGVEIGGRKYTSEEVSQAAMSLVTLGDRMTTYPIWQGAYLKAMDKGMSQKDAIAYADGVVSKTQAVAGEADINAWQRDQTGIKRLFTMFMSETLRKGSRMRYWFHALTHGKISVAEYCGHFAAETFGVTMLYLAMRALLSSSEPDPEDVLMALFDEVTGPLPFVNQISGSIQYGRGVGQLSSMKGVDLGVSLIGKTWKWAHKPTDSDAIEGMFKAAVDLTAFELGVGNARRIYRQAAEGWDDISHGKSVNPFRMFIKGFDK